MAIKVIKGAQIISGDKVKFIDTPANRKALIGYGGSLPVECLLGQGEIVDYTEGGDLIYFENGDGFPINFFERVSKSKQKETVTIQSKGTEPFGNLTFVKGYKYAELDCGDTIDLNVLIQIGEIAKQFLPSPRKPAAKKAKVAAKKKK